MSSIMRVWYMYTSAKAVEKYCMFELEKLSLPRCAVGVNRRYLRKT